MKVKNGNMNYSQLELGIYPSVKKQFFQKLG